ncbi:unnamed protein product [Chondrus crispus]|uniref:Uncharacterized protein n=1 Tax=Chondrus crispus TaxID=2769 RepID=R7QRH0_CHOCR|nr:unnamed protein product [Chondrus crispus]CDF40744.1 unnamed protein product [Chondrus crispus]|eukprot:XP_005711038.1 unnamed protein product [Chondrus crispus]
MGRALIGAGGGEGGLGRAVVRAGLNRARSCPPPPLLYQFSDLAILHWPSPSPSVRRKGSPQALCWTVPQSPARNWRPRASAHAPSTFTRSSATSVATSVADGAEHVHIPTPGNHSRSADQIHLTTVHHFELYVPYSGVFFHIRAHTPAYSTARCPLYNKQRSGERPSAASHPNLTLPTCWLPNPFRKSTENMHTVLLRRLCTTVSCSRSCAYTI